MSKKQVEMKIRGLLIDPITRMPIIVLHDQVKTGKVLPIWVGIFEANAIAIKMEDVPSPRPMTHDLLNNVLSGLKCNLTKIEIVELRENTYFANLVVENGNGEEVRIDARPSDAIALSLRTESPIFVSEEVIEKAGTTSEAVETENMQEEDLKKWFESLSPEIMSKYKM